MEDTESIIQKIDSVLVSLFGLGFVDIVSKNQHQPYKDIRHALHYSLLQIMDNASARTITQRGRVTFISSVQSCEDRMFVDNIYKRQVNKLISELRKIYDIDPKETNERREARPGIQPGA